MVRGGFLGLGSKETLHFSKHAEEFSAFDAGERIYRRLPQAMTLGAGHGVA